MRSLLSLTTTLGAAALTTLLLPLGLAASTEQTWHPHVSLLRHHHGHHRGQMKHHHRLRHHRRHRSFDKPAEEAKDKAEAAKEAAMEAPKAEERGQAKAMDDSPY